MATLMKIQIKLILKIKCAMSYLLLVETEFLTFIP